MGGDCVVCGVYLQDQIEKFLKWLERVIDVSFIVVIRIKFLYLD